MHMVIIVSRYPWLKDHTDARKCVTRSPGRSNACRAPDATITKRQRKAVCIRLGSTNPTTTAYAEHHANICTAAAWEQLHQQQPPNPRRVQGHTAVNVSTCLHKINGRRLSPGKHSTPATWQLQTHNTHQPPTAAAHTASSQLADADRHPPSCKHLAHTHTHTVAGSSVALPRVPPCLLLLLWWLQHSIGVG